MFSDKRSLLDKKVGFSLSAKATGLVLECDLPRQEKYVLIALADHAKEDGTDIRPSLWRVCWKTDYSETQVRSIFKSLRAKNILILTHQGGKYDGDVNIYRIDFKALPMLPDFKEWSAAKREKEKKKGTESAPVRDKKPHPQEGTVSGAGGCGLPSNEGTVATAPKPSTSRTVRIEQDLGNGASPLPPQFALEAEQPKQKTKPQDPRFPEICEAIRKCWPQGDGYKCDITAADASAINRMLANKHDWLREELAICIVARFMSDSINPTESVKAWICAVTDYQSGPRDKYGVPKYYNDNLDHWRMQARRMLYGPSPEQMRLQVDGKDAEREQVQNELNRLQRDSELMEQEIERLKGLPPDSLEPMKAEAETKFELRKYRGQMPASEYLNIVLRSIARMNVPRGMA